MKPQRIAEKLARLLDASPKSQEEVAAETKSKASRVSDWKHGRRRPTIAQLLLLGRSLGVPVEYLLDDTMDGPPASEPALAADEAALLDVMRARGIKPADVLKLLIPNAGAESLSPPAKDQAPKNRRA